MKLISMTDFVLDRYKNAPLEDYDQVNETFINSVVRYAEFLKKPLTLGMFVPCDEGGNVLDCTEENLTEFNSAAERVMFEGFTLSHKNNIITLVTNTNLESKDKSIGFGFKNGSHSNIESIVYRKLTLTPAAVKQIL